LLTLDNEFMNCSPITPQTVASAVESLARGRLAVLPTDTVYGLCADVREDDAVRSLYAAKGKGPEAPLQLLFGDDTGMLERYAVLTGAAQRLIEELGPGGWTVITRAVDTWTSPVLAGGRTVGVRIPPMPVIGEVVSGLGAPLAASSANKHGDASPTTCKDAIASVGGACAVALDGGPTPAGLDSTVVDCAGEEPVILREGAIDRGTIARILGIRDIAVLRSVRP
jgi:L-threonylcarbamoyladenylate synthase